MTVHLFRRSSTGLAAIVAGLALASCGGTEGASGNDLPTTKTSGSAMTTSATPTPSSSASTSSKPRPVAYSLKIPGHTVRATMSAPDRFRPDGSIRGRLHFLPLNVVTDNKAERWGDFFLFAPTRVYAPAGQRLVPVPDDLVRWMRSSPKVRVVSSRTHDFGGTTAHELNVERDGSPIFPDDEAGPPGGLERYVLWQVDDVWLVGQASTFRGMSGITAPSGREDVFMSFLRSARLLTKG
jgi:hypothetical protein